MTMFWRSMSGKNLTFPRSIQVRSDGKISLPLLGEVQATGRTPLQLEHDITTKLRNYITKPEVTVMVEQINSKKFNILGQVAKPGSYSLALAPTIVDAIAIAGGPRDFAKQKSIYILRQNPGGGEIRIAFNYKDFLKGKDSERQARAARHGRRALKAAYAHTCLSRSCAADGHAGLVSDGSDSHSRCQPHPTDEAQMLTPPPVSARVIRR